MAALLNTTDPNNRLIEALGSAALFSDNTSASSPLGLPLNALDLGGNSDTAVDGDGASTSGQATSSLDIASLLGATNGDIGLTDALPLDHVVNGLPVIGNAEAGSILSGLDIGDLGLGDLGLGNLGLGDHGLGDVGPGNLGLGDLGLGSLGLGDIGLGNGESTPGTGSTPLDLAGAGTTPQPVFDVANAVIKDVHYTLEVLSHEVGLQNAIHGVTNLGETIGLGEIGAAPGADGSSNLITDTLNLPGDIVSGNLNGGISNISHDLIDTVHGVSAIVNTVLFDGPHGNDLSNPVPEIISGLGNSLQNLPLLTIDNGTTGGLLGGVIGDLSHSSSGHLVDADVGPQQSNGLVLDLLAGQSSDGHTASVNAVDVGPNGPHLADLGLLTGGSNSDGLAGNLLGGDHGLLGSVTSGGATTAPTAIVAQVVDVVPVVGGLDHGLLDLHSAHII